MYDVRIKKLLEEPSQHVNFTNISCWKNSFVIISIIDILQNTATHAHLAHVHIWNPVKQLCWTFLRI